MDADERFIERTYELAEAAGERGDFPFGALVTVGSTVVQTADNTVESDQDITAHPELKLARWAARELDAEDRSQATLYASAEPCPMCAGTIYWAGIPRVVFGVRANAAGGSGVIPTLECETVIDSGSRSITVEGPVKEQEGLAMMDRFWSRDPETTFSQDLFSGAQ